MNKETRVFVLEKRLFLPLLCIMLLGFLAYALAAVADGIFENTAAPWQWACIAVCAACTGFFSSVIMERRRNKKLYRALILLVLAGLWFVLALIFFPAQESFDFEVLIPWQRILSALGIFVFFNTAVSASKLIAIPIMIPVNKILMGEKFKEWVHNYLQDVSVVRIASKMRRRGLGIYILGCISAATAMLLQPEAHPELGWLAVVAALALLLLYSNMYKYILYASWAIRQIYVKPHFFKQWLRFSCMVIAVSFLVSIPMLSMDTEVVVTETVWSEIAGFFRGIHRAGREQDRSSLDDAYLDRQLEKAQEEIKEEEQRELDRLEGREAPLRKLFRFSAYMILALIALALAGGVIKRVYQHRHIPAPLLVPVFLWLILSQFIAFIWYFMRMMVGKRPYPSNETRLSEIKSTLQKEMMPHDIVLSDEKKKEMQNILDIYMAFIREAESRGILYRTGFTPNEYAAHATQIRPELRPSLLPLTAIFYQARYSPDILGISVITQAGVLYKMGEDDLAKLPLTNQ